MEDKIEITKPRKMNEKIKWFGRYLGCDTVWMNSEHKAEPKIGRAHV